MGFKKILLIITLLAILTWLFGGNIPIAQAQTVEELKTQITTLQNQINQLKTRLAEIEKEANSVAAAISKLAEKAKVKPESEYKCPDVNRDGKVDIVDMTLVIGSVDACTGNIKYDEKRDFDWDGCVTNTDLEYVKKYFGKLTGAITQCTGGVTLEYMEKTVASIADAIFQLTERIKGLLK